VFRLLSRLALLAVFICSTAAQASVFGEYTRADSVDEKYPQQLQIKHFSKATVDGMSCRWKNAGHFELKTDKGNTTLAKNYMSPNTIKVNCEGKQPFYVVDVSRQLLNRGASKGSVGVWFGDTKDRYGCEGYNGCDSVQVIETYVTTKSNANGQSSSETALEQW
jgi:hypothetical protein